MDTFCCYWQKVTRRRQQKREISWTAESCLHKYSPPLRSQRSHRPWQSVPHGRASGFFNCPRSGSVSRNTPIPCFGGIQDAALAHKRGSLETLGFKRHSLGTFCRYWQSYPSETTKKRNIMNRRRHKRNLRQTFCLGTHLRIEQETGRDAGLL